MAALDFPNSPTTNQQYAAPNGITYQWDSAAWVVTGGPPATPTGPAGGDLAGTYPNPTVIKSSGSFGVNGAVTAVTNVTFNTTNASAVGNLEYYSSTGVQLACNDRFAPGAPTAASWNMQLDTVGYAGFYHRAANAAAGSTDQNLLFDANGSLYITGTYAQKASGTTWANPSDRRLKDDIADYATGLAAVIALSPRTFVYNGKGGSQAGLRGYGYIADEAAAVMPEMLGSTRTKLNPDDEEETDIQTLDTSNVVLALVNAVKELAARLAALEAHA